MSLTEIHDPVVFAFPVFVVFLVLEILAIHVLHHDQFATGAEPDRGYDPADTRTSLTMGIGYSVVNLFWRLVVLVVYSALYELTPLRLSPGYWWTWLIVFFADDLAYYLLPPGLAPGSVVLGRPRGAPLRRRTTTSPPRCGRSGRRC